MQIVIGGQDDVGVEDSVRVTCSLDFTHDRVELGPILSLDKRGHDATGAMLCFERAPGRENHVDHVFGEGAVASHACC